MIRPILLVLLLLVGVGWGFHLFTLPWTSDEGFYLMVVRLLGEGKQLYADLIYGHLPLFPHLLSGWQAVIGKGLIEARLLSIFNVILFGAGIWWILAKAEVPISVRLSCLIILFTHPFSWRYFPIVKPYAVGFACIILSDILLRKPRSQIFFVLAGLLLGVAINSRLIFVFAAPVLAGFWIRNLKALACFAVGVLLASIPSIVALVSYPDRTLFGWFGFHRSHSALVSLTDWKRQWRSLGLAFNEAAWIVVALLAGSAIYINRKTPEVWKSAREFFILALALTLPAFRLVPLYDEYFFPILLFGVVGIFIAAGKNYLFERISFVAAVLSFSLWIGEGKKAIAAAFEEKRNRPMNSLQSVREVEKGISELTKPGDEVLSFWSGYLVGLDRKIIPGMLDGPSVPMMHKKISREEAARYHIATVDEIIDWVQKKRPKLIVVGLGTPKGFEKLVQLNYRLARETGGARLYVR